MVLEALVTSTLNPHKFALSQGDKVQNSMCIFDALLIALWTAEEI